MDVKMRSPEAVHHDVTGDPIDAGSWSVRPVAKMTGRAWRGGSSSGSVGGAVVKLTPVEAIVLDTHGSEQRVKISDPTAEAMAGMKVAGVAVAAISIALCLAASVICLLPKGTGDATDTP